MPLDLAGVALFGTADTVVDRDQLGGEVDRLLLVDIELDRDHFIFQGTQDFPPVNSEVVDIKYDFRVGRLQPADLNRRTAYRNIAKIAR